MYEVDCFEKKLKEATQLMYKGQAKLAELRLKQLQKEVRLFFQKQKIEQSDKLSEIQIAIYNNLSCIFEKKGKYKSSLYHLSLAQKLENAYFTHKYNEKSIPVSAFEKLATTYSNLSAIQSKLGNSKEALQNIQFAIEIMKKNETLNTHQSFIFLYYNYSVLLEGASRFLQASKFALEGMELVKKLNEQTMKEKYEELLHRLKNHLKRQQLRKEKIIQKYVKAETGVYKDLNQLQLDKEQLSKYELSEDTHMLMFKTINRKKQLADDFPVYTRQKMSYYRPRVQTHISNRKARQSASVGVFDSQMKGKIVKTNKASETSFTNKISQSMNRTTVGIMQAYRLDDKFVLNQKRRKQYSTLCRDTIQRRINKKKQRLQLQINALGQNNEALQKVIQKLYMTGKSQASFKTIKQ